ncbi:MAG: nickel pincer cofactor biosynthesis protein LarB [bacterium]|nr:nickel pincer cofactor biosynthesis protein LarB [bacterium]
MDELRIRELLEAVRGGSLEVDAAVASLRSLPFEDLGFAKIDHHRAIRCGFPEVIYCEGKTVEQVVAIVEARAAAGGNVLGTRATQEMFDAVHRRLPQAVYNASARTIVLRRVEPEQSATSVAIVSAGTSDMPVAEEARETAEIMGQRTECFYDVGVAGIHRLLAHSARLQEASAIIVVAGMEGALASVVGGLVDCPVIAVPTSIGYGASFHGLAALLAMLNSCAAGVAVVNIDNGFSAGYIAAQINLRMNTRAGGCDPHEVTNPPDETER